MPFLDDHYLLTSEPARDLFDRVRNLPIVDPHNHALPEEIAANRHWSDIWQVEGATDHYVWELMRRRGVTEKYITGESSNREKWRALAEKFPEFIGNPTYEWVHLDLKNHFRISDPISAETEARIWEVTREKLQLDEMRPQEVLERMRVEIMCTTDDPTMRLPHHEAAQGVQYTSIVPTWRPDRVMDIEGATWRSAVTRLGEETDEETSTLEGLLLALGKTHRYFQRMGCVASDHGLTQPISRDVPATKARAIHRRAWEKKELSLQEVQDYRAFLLNEFGAMNQAAGWVTQLHIGAIRDYRTQLLQQVGTDSGGDISSQDIEFVENLRYFLNRFDSRLKIVLYCVDPTHFPTLATMARAYPNVFLGAAWWWNDSPFGMETQLKYYATVDLLANFAGMVTDSRKLISFGSRTEMFRRVLCNVVGDMLIRNQFPEGPAEVLVESLSYHRPYELFFG